MKIESKILIAASLGLLSVTSTAFAEDEVKATPAPTLANVLESSGITATGYVAASYFHSSELNADHQFDTGHETFQLDQAAFTLAYQPKEGFGALVNVVAGQDARVINAATSANSASGPESSPYSIAQAYVQYAGGPVTVIAGKFATLAGAEVFAISGNTNYSRSLLFFNEPLVHTGVRATIAANDMLSFIVGVNNGWNYDNSFSSKTAEVGFSFMPVKAFTLGVQGYSGEDPVGIIGVCSTGPTGWCPGKKTLIDLVATYNATDALTFILNYDNGKQDFDNSTPSVKWNGAAGYVNYAFNDQWRVSVRGEYLTTTFTGAPDQKLNEFTLTFGYAPVKSFELRMEARSDSSNKDSTAFPDGLFMKNEPTPTSAFTDGQFELALQGVYKF